MLAAQVIARSYMGRWSGQIAIRFLDWLDQSENFDWLVVGCGTGRYLPLSYRDVIRRALSPSIRSKGFLQRLEQT